LAVQTAEQAEAAAVKFGFPAVLKIARSQILHKTSAGGVALNLKTNQQVHGAFELIMHRASTERPDAHLEGIQVHHMAKAGCEVIVGIVRDEQFGPLIMLGLGGTDRTMVEGMKDITSRVAPLTKEDYTEMIE
jgi:acetyltransferase